jgi:trans-aconitate 2-methyltransferase
MTRWGEAVVGWLDLAGDEWVLDAGCGTGKVTAALRDRRPRGRVMAHDGPGAPAPRPAGRAPSTVLHR